MSDNLELASTSDENEIKNKIPFDKANLRYSYYPNTSIFIGNIKIPHLNDYISDQVCSKLKADIKAEYPLIDENILGYNISFFESNFRFLFNLKLNKNLKFKQIQEEKKYKEIDLEKTMKINKNSFNPKNYQVKKKYKKIITVEDFHLKQMKNKNCFIKIEIKENRITLGEVYYSNISFYDFIDFIIYKIIKGNNSLEIKEIEQNKNLIVLYSLSTFINKKETIRLFPSFEEGKSHKLFLSKEKIKKIKYPSSNTAELQVLKDLETLPEGEFVINEEKVYEIGKKGIKVEYKGVNYEDFINNI